MRFEFVVLAFLFAGFIPSGDFKSAQLKNFRVKTAFTEKEKTLLDTLKSKNIQATQLRIFLRIYFENKKQLPVIRVQEDGYYSFQ